MATKNMMDVDEDPNAAGSDASSTLYHFERNDFYFEWNIRADPDPNARVVGTLMAEEVFEVTEVSGAWLKIRTKEKVSGWALSEIMGVKMLKPFEGRSSGKDITTEQMNLAGMTEDEMLARALEMSVKTAHDERLKRKKLGLSGLEGVSTKSNSAKADVDFYLAGYPGVFDDKEQRDNLLFYRNELPSRPDGLLIEEFLKDKADQPTERARPMQLHEAKAIASDPVLRSRVVRVYAMILDFFGMCLKNEKTGEIARLPDGSWEARYKNLQESSHNYLRITRILKFLGEVGFEHYKAPLVSFMLDEMIESWELTNAAQSLLTYFIPVIRSEKERSVLKMRAEMLIPPPSTPLDVRLKSLREILANAVAKHGTKSPHQGDDVDSTKDDREDGNDENASAKTKSSDSSRAVIDPVLPLSLLKRFAALAFHYVKNSDSFAIDVKAAVELSKIILPAAGAAIDISKWISFLEGQSKSQGFGISSWAWNRLIDFSRNTHACTGSCDDFDPPKWPLLFENYVEAITGRPVRRSVVSTKTGSHDFMDAILTPPKAPKGPFLVTQITLHPSGVISPCEVSKFALSSTDLGHKQ